MKSSIIGPNNNLKARFLFTKFGKSSFTSDFLVLLVYGLQLLKDIKSNKKFVCTDYHIFEFTSFHKYTIL